MPRRNRMLRPTQQSSRRVIRIVPSAIKEHPNPQRDPDFLRFARRFFSVLLILRPTLGVDVDGFGFFVAVVFRGVWDVAAQSLIPCSDP